MECIVAIGNMYICSVYCVPSPSWCVYNKTPKLFDTWHFHCANKRGKNAIKPKELQFHSFCVYFFHTKNDKENHRNA